MDRAKAERVHEELRAAIAAVLAKHGLTIKKRRPGFGSIDLRLSIEAVEEGQEHEREAEALRQLAQLYGTRAEVVGATIRYGTQDWKIIGLRGNGNAKAPIIAQKVGTGALAYLDLEAFKIAALAAGFGMKPYEVLASAKRS